MDATIPTLSSSNVILAPHHCGLAPALDRPQSQPVSTVAQSLTSASNRPPRFTLTSLRHAFSRLLCCSGGTGADQAPVQPGRHAWTTVRQTSQDRGAGFVQTTLTNHGNLPS